MNNNALLIGGIVILVIVAFLMLNQPASPPGGTPDVTGDQPKIMVVMNLHMDPLGTRGDEQQRLAEYARHRDSFLWLQDMAREKGFKITAEATGLYAEFAVRNGDLQDFEDFMPGGTHMLGTHMHSHYKGGQDTEPYSWTEDETHSDALAQQVYDDQIDWINQIFTGLGFKENDNHLFHGSHTSMEAVDTTPNVFDISGGPRGKYHPMRVGSSIAIPAAAGIMGRDALHGPEGMLYGTLPFVQRDFVLEYADWWYYNKQGLPPVVWVFGHDCHVLEYTQGFEGTDGIEIRESLTSYYDWMNSNFHGVIEYATLDEVAEAFKGSGDDSQHPVMVQAFLDILNEHAFYYVDMRTVDGNMVFEFGNDGGGSALLVLPEKPGPGDFSEFFPGQAVVVDLTGTSSTAHAGDIALSGEPLLILSQGYEGYKPSVGTSSADPAECMDACILSGGEPYECGPECGLEPGLGQGDGCLQQCIQGGRMPHECEQECGLEPGTHGGGQQNPCGDGVCNEIERQRGICPQDCDQATSGDSTIGYLGCSLTIIATSGYSELGGSIWGPVDAYPGGHVTAWHQGLTSDPQGRWGAFRDMIDRNPQTQDIWWMMCHSPETTDQTYEDMLQILEEIESIAPGKNIYVSSSPVFPDDVAQTLCKGEEGPALLAQFVDRMVSEGRAERGPTLTALDSAQIGEDGCHPNQDGKSMWGQDLMDLFG